MSKDIKEVLLEEFDQLDAENSYKMNVLGMGQAKWDRLKEWLSNAIDRVREEQMRKERDRVLKILKEHDKSIESRVLEVVYPPKVVYTPDFSVEIKNLTEEE